MSMKIGAPLFKQMAQGGPDFISSDCALAGHHIAQGIEENKLGTADGGPPLAHPLTLLRRAYGI
jgi:glycerol-3-phosphate dehydrogenase subunit C